VHYNPVKQKSSEKALKRFRKEKENFHRKGIENTEKYYRKSKEKTQEIYCGKRT